MKKLILTLSIFFTAIITLAGCTNTSNSEQKKELSAKETAVVAAKAYVGGVIQGDKTTFENYYGKDSYKALEEKSKQSFNINASSSITPEEALKSVHKAYSTIKIEYKENTDTTVSLRIYPKKLNQTTFTAWAQKIPESDRTDSDKLNVLMFNAIADGSLQFSDGDPVDKTISLEKENDKLIISKTDESTLLSSMIDFSGH